MTRIKYEKLMEHDPYLIRIQENSFGQEIHYYEHPIRGDEDTLIAVHHPTKQAISTEFWDDGDFYEGSEYNYVFTQDKIGCEMDFTKEEVITNG